MEEIQTIKITREEMEKLSEDFLLRMLRLVAIWRDWPRVIATTVFLPDALAKKEMTELILAGNDGLEEIRNQAKDGRDIFKYARPTAEEQKREKEFAEIIEQQIKNRGGFETDIVHEISLIEDHELSVAEIESLILVCVNKGYYDMAREAATLLPLTKRVQAIAILS